MTDSFAVGGTTVNFLLIDQDDFTDHAGLGQDMSMAVVLANMAAYDSLATLITRQINVDYPPSGTAPVVDLGFGAGGGTLTITTMTASPYSAALKDLTRPSHYPDGRVRASAVFVKLP